jgi:hypothetical protein
MFEAKKETPSLRSVRPQGRFGFGQETAHDLGHRQDFLDSARGLPGSKQSLVRPAGLVRRQYLAPQAIAIVPSRASRSVQRTMPASISQR